MTAREVVLDGGSPWGFRMHGGVDVQQPLRISRVNPGSKAANKGIREGDIITSINNQPTRDLSNSDAHVLLKRSGDSLKLGLNEDCKGSPKRRQYKIVQQENHSESIERSSTASCTKTVTVTINRKQSDPNESEPLLLKYHTQSQQNGEPEHGVISQRSTLSSSSCSSSPSVTSFQGEPKGVWSPGQKHVEEKPKQGSVEQNRREEDEATPAVWIPRSAGSSPTAERKEFKSVNFESPTLGRKNKSQTENSKTEEPQPPWKVSTSTNDVGASLSSTLDKRLPTSHSAPAAGFTEFSSSRLPKAQNPTITLLQKAREGQLPRGASYIQSESTLYKRDDKPPVLTPGQVLYHIKNEYTVSDSEGEKTRRMADLGHRKYDFGIGPVTKDGMPLVLRSEIKDGNQSRWYKKMYETIHKQKPEREYVTVRYKQRRGIVEFKKLVWLIKSSRYHQLDFD